MRIKDIVKSKKNYAFYTSEDYGHDFPRLYTGVFVPDYCTAGIPAGVTSSFYGPPGSNKCLKQDALVFSDKGIVEIGSFKDGRDKGFTDFSETFSGPDGKPVPSSQYYIDETEDIVYIKNSLGLELEGTPSHKIRFLNKDAEFEMKKLAGIEEGDIACICRDNSVFSKENVELPKYSRDFHSNANEADLPNKCTPELARLFGYLIANGFNSGKSALGISTKNKNIKQDIDVICGNLGLNVGKHLKGGTFTVGGIKFKDIVFSCLEVKKFPTARFKKIPNIILKSTKEVQLNFLQALFDCDAHLEKRGCIVYSTASEILAKQVQILLLSRGFISSRHPQYLKKYDHTYWSVVLTVGDTHEFLKKVNSIKYCGYDKEFSSRTNVDLIHNLKDVLITKVKDIKELFKVNAAGTYYHNDLFLRFTVGHVCHSHIDRAVTYPWLQNVIEQLENTPQIPEVVELIEFCKVFIDKNYFYSPIVKVQHKKEKVEVYDFNIPGDHLYLSNGYVSHNSSLSTKLLGMAQKTCWNCFEYIWDCKCGEQKTKKSVVVTTEKFDFDWAKNLGCDVDELIVAEPSTGEEAVDIIYEVLNADDCGLLVLDSLARIIPEQEITDPALSYQVGMRARLHAKLMNKVKATLIRQKRKGNLSAFVATNQVRSLFGSRSPGGEDQPGGFASKHDWHLTCRLGSLKPEAQFIDKETELPMYSKSSLSLVSPGIKRKLFTLAGKGQFYIALEDTKECAKGDSYDYKTTFDYAVRLGLLDKNKWYFKPDETEYGTKKALFDYWKDNPLQYFTAKRRIIEHVANIKRGLIEDISPKKEESEEDGADN